MDQAYQTHYIGFVNLPTLENGRIQVAFDCSSALDESARDMLFLDEICIKAGSARLFYEALRNAGFTVDVTLAPSLLLKSLLDQDLAIDYLALGDTEQQPLRQTC